MRAWCKAAWLVGCVLIGSTEAASAACTAAVEKIQAGQVPAAGDLGAGSCSNDAVPEMATALASFLTEADDGDDTRRRVAHETIAIVRSTLGGADRQSAFRAFADGLHRQLAGTDLAFDLKSTEDVFDLLDNLSKILGQPSRGQIVDPGPSPGLGPKPTPSLGALGTEPGTVVEPVDNDVTPEKGHRGIITALVLLFLMLLAGMTIVSILLRRLFNELTDPARRLDEMRSTLKAELKQEIKSDVMVGIGNRRGVGANFEVPSAPQDSTRLVEPAKTAPLIDQQGAETIAKAIRDAVRPAAPPPPGPDLTKYIASLAKYTDAMHLNLQALAQQRPAQQQPSPPPPRSPQPSPAPPQPAVSPVDLEREILNETWKKFRENKEIVAAVEGARDNGWGEIHGPLLESLPQHVFEDKATFDAVLAPAKDYANLLAKLSLIPRLLPGDPSPVPPLDSNTQEMTRLREFTNLLTLIQNSNVVADRLQFRPKSWIADHFISFADLYLKRYLEAGLAGNAGRYEEGLRIVREILRVADIRPVELTLGQTPFDSNEHIGKSTIRDTSFSDGIILGVVRNGFTRGGRVLRQPEVVVNRV
jgi:hypothetical protein